MTYQISYQMMRDKLGKPAETREVTVHATPEEIETLDREGYLVRDGLLAGKWLADLCAVIDRLADAEWAAIRPPGEQLKPRTWGAILRHLVDKDEIFHELIRHPPLLSVARAMMGPLVRVRGTHARITFAGEEPQDIPWHQHLRVITDPKPPWFAVPHAMDCLIYLDELTDETGTLAIIPGSHRRDTEPPGQHYDSLPDEVQLRVSAGSVVFIHANLWHRALPTLSGKRRMMILSYTPTWLRESPHGGPPPPGGLTGKLIAEGDTELLELLGVKGFT